jgi:hypothetical protein
MPRMPALKRVLLVIASIVVVGLPILLYIFTHPRETVLFPTPLNPQKPEVSAQFGAESQVPGYTLTLADTRFLDYVTVTLDLFAPDALADPRHWRKQFIVTQRITVKRAQFVLVQDVPSPIGFVVNPKTAEIFGRGGYDTDGDTLIIRVAFDTDALAKAGKTDTGSLEDVFLNTIIKTMYYAKGAANPEEDRRVFGQFKVDMEEYLYKTKIFTRPFRIERRNV